MKKKKFKDFELEKISNTETLVRDKVTGNSIVTTAPATTLKGFNSYWGVMEFIMNGYKKDEYETVFADRDGRFKFNREQLDNSFSVTNKRQVTPSRLLEIFKKYIGEEVEFLGEDIVLEALIDAGMKKGEVQEVFPDLIKKGGE